MAIAPPYKAIVLFTPGGDVLYAVDRDKTRHWHFDLCLGIQSLLKLRETPHFLVPHYTATVDVGRPALNETPRIFAEIHTPVYHHRYFLNALFEFPHLSWQRAKSVPEILDAELLLSYAQQFPELWQGHNWVVPLEQVMSLSQEITRSSSPSGDPPHSLRSRPSTPQPSVVGALHYVLRLYVSGYGIQTKQSLQELHQCLEQGLHAPYSLKVIDVHREPELAEQDQVTAIPTLIRTYPPPVRRIVGKFADPQQLVGLLQDLG
ncbi:MAG: circadian clock KaiB family protein [Prochlorotrichaceae cyanobacterium]|jgi:circadian clock protein KaiB